MAATLAIGGGVVATAQSLPAAVIDPNTAASRLADLTHHVPALGGGRLIANAGSDPAVNSAPIDGLTDVIDFSHARRPTVRGSAPIFVAPTRDGSSLCVGGSGRLICGSLASIRSVGVAVVVSKTVDAGYAITAAVDSSVGPLKLTYPDGTSEQVTAQSGVISQPIKANPDMVSWIAPDGSLQTLNTRTSITQ